MLLLEALLLLIALHRVGIDRLVGVVEVGVERDDVIVQRPRAMLACCGASWSTLLIFCC